MKKIRIYYQIFFLFLFFLLLYLAAQGNLKGYPVTALLDSSPLNALGALFSSWNVAHTMWLGFIILALSFFLGRFFCSFICPLGTIFHFISWLSQNKKISEKIKVNKYSFLQIYKFSLLIILLTCALFGGLQIGLFDPISLLTRTSVVFIYPVIDSKFFAGGNYVFPTAPLIVAFFTLILLLNVYRPRFWCRYVCPLGALLGLAAKAAPGGFVRDENKVISLKSGEHKVPSGTLDVLSAFYYARRMIFKNKFEKIFNFQSRLPNLLLFANISQQRKQLHKSFKQKFAHGVVSLGR